MSRWFILPGMGATPSMYDSLCQNIDFRIEFINWPEYHGERTYAEIARRIVKENEIVEGDVVGGSSLGGMVALEIAEMIQVKAFILIGSALQTKEVKPLLSALSPLAAITPISLIQLLAGKRADLVSQMFADSNPEFIRAMCQYLNEWQGFHGPLDRVFRIHGKKDHVITCPTRGSEYIADAGHLLAITHAEETAGFVQRTHSHLTRCHT